MTDLTDIFGRLIAKMPFLRGSDFKIAVYLVAQVVAKGTAEIEASVRGLAYATGVSRSNIQIALVRLEESGLFIRVRGGHHKKDRYLLPAFRPANSGVPVLGTPLEPGVPVLGTPLEPGVPVLGTPLEPGVPVLGTPLEPGVPVLGTPLEPGVPVLGTPLEPGVPVLGTDIKERARASNSFVGSSISSIDSILQTQTLRPDQAGDAERLRRHMRAFIERIADASLIGCEIDDAIVAQCLAIAPLGALQNCLDDLRARRVPPFQSLGWFVVAFAKAFLGVSPSQVKARRGALRVVPKPVNSETHDPKWSGDLTNQLVSSVRGLG